MVLQWNATDGGWTACDVPPALVHGVALIRAGQPPICLFARDDKLQLQVAAQRFELTGVEPRLGWRRDLTTFGLRRLFTVESEQPGPPFKHTYWNNQADEFFAWLATRAADSDWRGTNARRWSEGLQPAALRLSLS